MGKFAISFRIADQTYAGRSYDERYQSLVDKLSDLSPWTETTSFALVSGDFAETQIRDYLVAHSKVSNIVDLILVINIETGDAATSGNVDYPYLLRSKLNQLDMK